MTITKEHWKAFQLYNQERRGLRLTAELMGVEVSDVRRLMTELKDMQPDLFPVEKMVREFGQKKLGLVPIDNIDEDEIQRKF